MPPKKKGAEPTGPKMVIKQTDMSEEMIAHARKAVGASFEQFKLEKDICLAVKKEFEEQYPQTTWSELALVAPVVAAAIVRFSCLLWAL